MLQSTNLKKKSWFMKVVEKDLMKEKLIADD